MKSLAKEAQVMGPETIEIAGSNGRKLGIRVTPIRDEDDEITGWNATTRELRWVPTDLAASSGTDREAAIAQQVEELRASGWLPDER